MSPYDRHEHEPETRPAVFGLGALVGMVLLGLIWVTVSDVTEDPVWPADRRDGVGLRANPSPNADRPSGPARLQRCANDAEALAVPLRAARPALKQWELHVGAMNSLVVGAITLQQATAFWNQTRVGAKARIAHFHAAEQALLQEHESCPVAVLRPHASPVLDSCLRQVEANSKALEAARTAISTWEMHVKDMDALRSGKLSPTAATQMWLSMWKRGTAELRIYHAAERAATRQTGCRAGDSAASRFVRPGPGSAGRAVASAQAGDLVRAGQIVRGISSRATRSGSSPGVTDPQGAAAPWPVAPPSGEAAPVRPGDVPEGGSLPTVTPTPGGEPGASAPPPIPPAGGSSTPAPTPDAPTSDAPEADVPYPGASGPRRQDQEHRQDQEPGGP